MRAAVNLLFSSRSLVTGGNAASPCKPWERTKTSAVVITSLRGPALEDFWIDFWFTEEIADVFTRQAFPIKRICLRSKCSLLHSETK